MQAFHSNWTRPFFIRNPHMEYRIEPFELLTTALSALEWRRENGSIRMICDTPAKRYYESLGLCFLWDDGVYPLFNTMPEDINATAFWAAGKLYALSAVPSPCVMLDTDFICWKSISNLLDGPDAASHPPRGHYAVHTIRIKRHSPKPKASRLIHLTGRYSRSIPRSPASAMTSSDGTTRTPPSASCAAHRMPTTHSPTWCSPSSGCSPCAPRKSTRTRLPSVTCLRCSAVRRTDISPISGASSSKCGRVPSCMRISADGVPQGCRRTSRRNPKRLRDIAELSPFFA